ncbi:TIGR03619 family F420-dependent LLM class oxidoreductase [Nocardioides sp.]|uniref:TIGR03619 family F420-dependent LLM class oxidoreductase n=1 Tax=Nocardioides sp. TaxID=35761 RepID=UPI00261713B9|nr:TIGR03619 family F420-dependent LLM class oxidoreductase [Nocardioides sp.]
MSTERAAVRWALPGAMIAAGDLAGFARSAEEAGYDAIAMPDSVFFPETVSADYPYTADGKRMWTGQTPMPDPFIAIASMAAVTSRMRFYTNVLKLPLRDPLLTAKQVATMAVLSGNRVELGVGLSWIPEEFAFTRTEMRTRGARTDEAIAILKAICAGNGPEWVEFHGRHYDFDRLMISPAPDRPVPVYVGGHSEPGLRRAARLADGWISVNADIAELRTVLARLGELRAEHGRADQPFEIKVSVDPRWERDAPEFDDLIALGVTEFRVSPWGRYGADFTNADARIDALQRYAEEMGIAP